MHRLLSRPITVQAQRSSFNRLSVLLGKDLSMGNRESRPRAVREIGRLSDAEAYQKLCKKLKELNALEGINGALGWDEMVMLPPGASAARGAQKEALAGVIYDKKTDAELGALLDKLAGLVKEAPPPPDAIPAPPLTAAAPPAAPPADSAKAGAGDESLEAAAAPVASDAAVEERPARDLDDSKELPWSMDAIAAAVVRDARRDYLRVTRLPKDLAQRIAKLESEAYAAWVEARKANDFSKFAPYLQQWVDVSREKARLIDPSRRPYNVLLEEYEKGMTQERLDEVFAQVREGLVPLIAAIKARTHEQDDAWMKGEYDVDKQAALCKEVSLALGFSLERGRVDVSVHPFTGGSHPTDVRITTRYKADDLSEGLTGAIHETGHALYEQGRNLKYDGLPVNSAMSMGIHESQSLLWERQVALSLPFARYLLPKLQSYFPSPFAGEGRTHEALYGALNTIRVPSIIRVEADEVTYPMHVILRYELEVGLIEGTVKVEDVPSLWRSKMKELLGDEPQTDAQGCLQDIHWSMGAIGYFPTYTLGAMCATQIFEAAKRDLPGLEEGLAQGQFAPLKEWLNAKIHQVGSLYPSADDLLRAATGAPLDPHVFLTYLKDKYTALYRL